MSAQDGNIIRIYHIEDSSKYINVVKELIASFRELEYVGSCISPEEGVREVVKHRPDIVLLDVEMPGKDGFWVAEQLKNLDVMIVFVTNHTEFAINAFKTFALHYLIKPVKYSDLFEVIERYRKRKPELLSRQSDQVSELVNSLKIMGEACPRRIFVNTQKFILVLQLVDVIYAKAEGSYTHFVMRDGSIVISGKNLKTYTAVLEKNPDFVKIHRSYVINQSALICIRKKKLDITFHFVNDHKVHVATFRKGDWMSNLDYSEE